MLFCAKANTAAVKTADAGKIRLGAGFRLPVTTADAGKIGLGAGFRLPVTTADAGKIGLGPASACRLPTPEHLAQLDTLLTVPRGD